MNPKKYNILVTDDNPEILNSIKTVLKEHNVITCMSIEEAKFKLSGDIDLILLDLVFDESFPDMLQGLDFIPIVHKMLPDLQIIVLTNYTAIDTIISAVKAGATDLINKKNLNWTEWKNRLENYCCNSVRIKELKENTLFCKDRYSDFEMIGESSEIDHIRKRLKDLAQNSSDVNIFIYGETGTGKNHAVRYFRKFSARMNKPYKEYSLIELSDSLLESELFGHVRGAFTGSVANKKGLFEEADGGILFLDEIGDYDLRTQKKIMRFIEDKSIIPVGCTTSKKLDVQLIMATNQDLPQLVSEGKFRQDLYQRINSIKIKLPALRERPEDIRLLADYFFLHFKEKEKTNLKEISEEVYQALSEYTWPGNIRELQLVIWDACTNARLHNDIILHLCHLKTELLQTKELTAAFSKETDIVYKQAILELNEIEKALEKVNGRKAEAAEILRMNADQLRYRILKYSVLYRNLLMQYKNISKYYKMV